MEEGKNLDVESEKMNVLVVTQDPQMIEVLDNLKSLASSVIPILVIGEPGTDKKKILRFMVEKGSRSNGPFVHIPTYLLASDEFENEMLGRGSVYSRTSSLGYLEMAKGGTMLFENIESMPLKNQPLLLELLEERRKIRKWQSREEIELDIHFIATANRDLRELVITGKFREDLYFRLSSLTIRLPPLRARKNDIDLLLRYFFDISKRGYNIESEYLVEPEVIDALKQYPWPGNVRELRNEIDRILIFHKGKITFDTISPYILKPKISDYPENQHDKVKSDEGYLSTRPHWRGGRIETKRDYCFVLMPFSEPWSNDAWRIIRESVTELGFICERADDRGGRVVMEDIWICINMANLIVADLTSRNPNVAYEVGMADVVGKEVIFLTQEIDNIPFDFLGQRLIVYDNSLSGVEKLKEELQRRIRLIFPAL